MIAALDSFFIPIVVAGLVGGASSGLLGVYIMGMRMPFVGVCISHAAMAGAVFGVLAGLPELPCALAAAAVATAVLGVIPPGRMRLDVNVAMGVLFPLMMGLTFLGIGLMQGPKTEILGLLWGSLLFVTERDVLLIVAAGLALLIFSALFAKEMRAILFSRMLAAATGVHGQLVYVLFLALCGLVLTVNLQTVGGLMIFALIANPAAAALQIGRGYRSICLLATGMGGISAVLGLWVAYELDLPTGACIVLVSTGFFLLALLWRRVRGELGWGE
ncbi:MAG: metal ABC transporter permease [Phycisphaerae bacterium]|nr:metal ABC transporter permease [Phycisphaerae bacterium]